MKQVLLVLAASFLIFGGCTIKNKLEIAQYSGYESTEYSNINIGACLQYPREWNIFDDQEKINNSKFWLFHQEGRIRTFYLLITPSKKFPYIYELEKLKYPIVVLTIFPGRVKRSKLPGNSVLQGVAYKIYVMKKGDITMSLIDGPKTIDINGKEWITFSAKMKAGNDFIKNYSYMDEEGKWYEYSAMCKLNKMKEYTHYFDQIIGSMKLVKN